MEKTNDKREYRRAIAVFQKADGKTYDYIAIEHRVQIRTTKKWINDYIKKGIEGLKIKKNHGGPRPRITDDWTLYVDTEFPLMVCLTDIGIVLPI